MCMACIELTLEHSAAGECMRAFLMGSLIVGKLFYEFYCVPY